MAIAFMAVPLEFGEGILCLDLGYVQGPEPSLVVRGALASDAFIAKGSNAQGTIRKAQENPFACVAEVTLDAWLLARNSPGHLDRMPFVLDESIGPGICHGSYLIEGFVGSHSEIEP
jgi:hypothetical protein